MAMTLESILARTREEGKDTLDKMSTLRENYIRDICREITTTYNFNWLEEVITVTSQGDGSWVNLPETTLRLLGVVCDNKPISPISEEMYFKSITLTQPAYVGQQVKYRERWNEDTRRRQITTVGADTAGLTLNLLVRKYYDTPDNMPPELEEAVVQGALFKFFIHMEGDDTQIALLHQKRYSGILNQLYLVSDMEMQDDDDDRVRTNDELEDMRATPYTGG